MLAIGRRHSTGGAATAPRCLSRKPNTDISAVTKASSRPSWTENGKPEAYEAGPSTLLGHMTRSRILLLVLAALALAAPAGADAAKPQRYLVSLGDSYATGFQATAVGEGHNTRNGFAYQVPKLAKAPGLRPQARQLRLRRRDDVIAARAQDRVPAARRWAAPTTRAGRRSPPPSGSSARTAARST